MIAQSVFYRTVRQFALTAPVWASDAIRFQTTVAHRWDVTLVSQAVYGNRDEFVAVMAAAGLNRFDDQLIEQVLVLPSPQRLQVIKQQCNYDSDSGR